jgi:hypothetical protein
VPTILLGFRLHAMCILSIGLREYSTHFLLLLFFFDWLDCGFLESMCSLLNPIKNDLFMVIFIFSYISLKKY